MAQVATWVLLLLVVGTRPAVYECKHYYAIKDPVPHHTAHSYCESHGNEMAKQCQPNELATVIMFNPIFDQKFLWIDGGRSCGPTQCSAISVDQMNARKVTWVCMACSEQNFVMCETENLASIQNAGNTVSRLGTNGIHSQSACDMTWRRRGDMEFMIVRSRMSFRFAVMFCVAVLHGQTLMDLSYTRSDIRFLSLPVTIPYLWISTPVQGNVSYARALLPSGNVEVLPNNLAHESVCQRRYVVHSSTTSMPTRITTTHQVSSETCSSPKVVGKFRHISQLDGYIARTDVFETRIQRSVLSCTRECLTNPDCQSFFYNVASRECQLLCHVITDDDPLEELAKTSYYVKV